MSAGQQASVQNSTFRQEAGLISSAVQATGAPASFQLNPDGTMTKSSGVRCSPWWNYPPQAGIGASFFARIDRLTGTGGNDGIANATTVQLNVARIWQQNVGGNGTFKFTIARDAGMTQIVSVVNNFTFSAS